MIDITTGRYWDLPWSLVSGCTPCSPGCRACCSARMTHRFHGGLTFWPTKAYPYPRFCGKIITHPERLSIPLQRKKPTVYAVWNDLFHEAVTPEFTFEAFEAMRNSQRHIFLVLTKRPQNINHDYFEIMERCIRNVFLGLTVCNQQEADEKIPVFLQVPGEKFLSIEPMLESVDLRTLNGHPFNVLEYPNGISAVILGGETGPGARPMHPDWVRSIRDQCTAAGVDFFFKGWGAWKPCDDDHRECRRHKSTAMRLTGELITDGKPGWRDKIFGGSDQGFWKAGSKSGRLLDGRTHDELPWRAGIESAAN